MKIEIPRAVLLLECFASRMSNIQHIKIEPGKAYATDGFRLGILAWECEDHFEPVYINKEYAKTILKGSTKESLFFVLDKKIIRNDGLEVPTELDIIYPDISYLLTKHSPSEISSINIDVALLVSLSTYLKKVYGNAEININFGVNDLSPVLIKSTSNYSGLNFTYFLMPLRK